MEAKWVVERLVQWVVLVKRCHYSEWVVLDERPLKHSYIEHICCRYLSNLLFTKWWIIVL